MYTLSDLKFAVQSPKSVVREANRLYYTRGRTYERNPGGIRIFEEDWDNLIILDACRYDFFAEQCDLPGTFEPRWSPASATKEFIIDNFAGRTLHDTVYLTANSWYMRLRDEIDSEVYELIDLHMGDGDGSYHTEEFKVVLPDAMTEQATRTAEEYPNKRLIVHYLQPHYPYFGPIGRRYFPPGPENMRENIAAVDATPRMVREAYSENLELVLSAVADLLPSLEGKTVITSDHGEMLGDRHDFLPMRDYGHAIKLYNEALTKVPWHVHEDGTRRRIVAEEPEADDREVDLELLEQRLEDLGYKRNP